jgi:phage-related minor tail protein
MELMQQLRSSTDRLMQSGTPLSIVIDMWRTKDPTTLQRKIAAWEEQQNKQKQQELDNQQQQVQQKIQQAQQQHEELMQFEYDKLDREDSNKQLDREAAIQEAEIKGLSFMKDTDLDKDGTPDLLEISKLALENTKTAYDKSLKDRELKLKEKQHNDDVALRKKEIQLSQKEIASREKIARMKPRPKVK